MYLGEFGHNLDNLNLPLLEEYLVKVLGMHDSVKAMDDAHYHVYHHSSKTLQSCHQPVE